MAKAAKNIFFLNHEETMDFFMKSEQYHGFELPEYFTFDEILNYVRETIGDTPYEECIQEGVSPNELANVNLDILLNKHGQYAVRIISRIIGFLKDIDEKRSIIDLVYHKLCNQPNSSYNQLWLQYMTYTQDKKHDTSPYTLRLCQLVAGKAVDPLWNNDWLKPELAISLPYDSVVDGETLKKVTPVITFRETRRYIETT